MYILFVVSGDDDLPQRDDIGERRRKLELRVLAGAGIKSGDDVDDGPGNLESDGDTDMEEEEEEEEEGGESETSAAVPSMPEVTLVDGKRQITYQMEKNRGLTRARKKLIKNPRKKYKLKHQKAVVRRKGQVRDIKKPMASYGGEASGINAGISRSIRFKN
ncbi:Something about silencing protein 10 [Camellia lanceoleosa]|uniref:Something about silencing protein 10 n=1 Tax=Camellia lanceoleosa TaxID=1840588 RepID=A0ACC0HBY1_9ERIC|nr:Something about silencing protein 10 [Camellia lanceoleosa]